MVHCCVRRRLSSFVTLRIVAKRCVLEQKLSYYWEPIGSRIHEKTIGTKMNDLDLCLEVVPKSRQPLHYIWRWISRKPLEIEAWFQRTTNRKWHMTNDVTWPWMVKLVTPICLKRNKLFELETSNLVCSFVWGMPSRHTNNFPWNWVWPWPLFTGCFASCRMHVQASPR